MKNISFMRNGKEFEPTKDELKRVLDDYAERLALTEKALELACEYGAFDTELLLREAQEELKNE